MAIDQTPYWEIVKLEPCNNHFNVAYQGFNKKEYIAEIAFTDGTWNDAEDIHYETKEDDAIRRFKESLKWYVSYLNDDEEHRKSILEFQIANARERETKLEVFYLDENQEWQHETWTYYKYDGFIEIVNPTVMFSVEIKRFPIKETSLITIVGWLLEDIKTVCGDNFMFYINF